MKAVNVLFLFIFSLIVSCGTIQSVSAIKNADKSREAALNKIIEVTGDSTLLVVDEYGNKSLSAKTGGEAAYNFFMADAYLKKARDLQSKGEHERAINTAEKSRDFAHKAVTLLDSMKKESEKKSGSDSNASGTERPTRMTIEMPKEDGSAAPAASDKTKEGDSK